MPPSSPRLDSSSKRSEFLSISLRPGNVSATLPVMKKSATRSKTSSEWSARCLKCLRTAVFTEDTDLPYRCTRRLAGIPHRYIPERTGRQRNPFAASKRNDRRATIRSAVAYATPGGDVAIFAHSVFGTVALKCFGDFASWIAPSADTPLNGGYNAIFIPDGQTRTLADIPPEESFSWSYRERTFADLFLFLRARGETASRQKPTRIPQTTKP